MYQQYLADPTSVDTSFRAFFEGIEFSQSSQEPTAGDPIPNLIHAYRIYGHLEAPINPLKGKSERFIKLEDHNLSEADLTKIFNTHGILPEKTAPLSKILERLQQIYTSRIGLEAFMFEERKPMYWLYEQFEKKIDYQFSEDEKKRFSEQLIEAEQLEIYINKTYPYITRFSIEGGESFVPMLIDLVNGCQSYDVDEMVIGMAHRGRLNLLANILNKPLSEIFFEFEPDYLPTTNLCSDLKYHNGLVSDITLPNERKLKMTLVGNPSHLESVNPIISGSARARQHFAQSKEKVIPIAIHGDAAFAGQGVVYETLQMGGVDGFNVGGTIHIVINNQIGYTAGPDESRSTHYSTAVARGFLIPVLHVNGEDVEGCIQAARIALEFRQRFGRDIVIDFNCYRRIGHNESDEVSYTNPVDYETIKKKPLISEIYRTDPDAISRSIAKFEKAHTEVEALKGRQMAEPVDFKLLEPTQTRVDEAQLRTFLDQVHKVPQDFNLNPKLKRIFDGRLKAIKDDPTGNVIDWGLAETLAFVSILEAGQDIRMSGQDSIRGTFSSRHAALYDVKTQSPYFPLKNLGQNQGDFQIYNSILSEFGVLGFELGYSMVHQKGLTVWEAQYGDFFNGAQIIFDQYVSSLYDKWEEMSSLIILLPHAMEGKGSEHSSARLERHLQMAANHNLYIVYPSTAAQYFHMFRRQALKRPCVPTIAFTPKGFLRYAPSFASLNELSSQDFQEVIDDSIDSCERLVLCSGHVYFDLVKRREEKGKANIAIVRIEQLYPLPDAQIRQVLEKYKGAKEYLWVQEEHRNQGAADHMFTYFRETLNGAYPFNYVGRPSSPVPAAGYSILHKQELEQLLSEAIG